MHSLLEEYLAQVSARLGPLPVARRNDEIKEMRQHLLNAVIVNREMGQNEDEAAAAAVKQCGPPEGATQGLVRAWRRGQRLQMRDFGGALVCTLVLSWIMVFVTPGFGTEANRPRWWPWAEMYSVMFAAQFLIGTANGLAFPRKAVVGTAVGTIGWYTFGLLWGLIFLPLVSARPVMYTVDLSSFMTNFAFEVSVAVLAAFLASRLRGTRKSRTTVPTT